MIETRTKQQHYNCILHHSIAMVGGFLAGYAVILRADFMGNAQTVNWLYLVFAILGHNFFEVLLRAIAVVLYMLGAMSYVYVKKRTSVDVRLASMIITACAMVILGFLPESLNPVIGLMPIFFAMSFQWNAFPGEYGYVSSTIFSTNNTRQVALSLAESILDHDKTKLDKTKFFLGSMLGFHIGIVIAYFTVHAWSVRAAWPGMLLLIPSILLYKKCVTGDDSD